MDSDASSVASTKSITTHRARPAKDGDGSTTFLETQERMDVDAGVRVIGSAPMLALRSTKGMTSEWRQYSDLMGLAKSLGGAVPVRYYLHASQNGFGRFRCEVMVAGKGRLPSYCRMMREVRGHLASPYYWDVDMINSSPTLLAQTLKMYGISCAALDSYVSERDARIVEVEEACGVARDVAKELFIRLMFFGSVDGWLEDHHEVDPLTVPQFVNLLRTQLQQAAARLLAHSDFQSVRAHVAAMHNARSALPGCSNSSSNSSNGSANGGTIGSQDPVRNLVGKTMALILQTKERVCLEALVAAVQASGRGIGGLIHDGIHVERLPDESALPCDLLEQWRARVLCDTGFDVGLTVKAFECNPVWLGESVASPSAGNEFWSDAWMQECDTSLMSYEDMKERWELRSFKVLTTSTFVRLERGQRVLYTRQRLIDSYEHLKYAIVQTDASGMVRVTRHPFIVAKRDGMPCWINDSNMRWYKFMDMVPPPLSCPPETYNTWDGFPAEPLAVVAEQPRPHPPVDIQSEGLRAVLEHIDILFNREPAVVKYVLDWVAQIVQQPGVKPGVALVLKGVEGAGKNRLGDLLKLLVGEHRALETCKPSNTLYGRFTAPREGKLVIIINEASGSENMAHNDTIKDMITGTSFVCEGKNSNAYTARCFARFVFLTNNDHVLSISQGARRFLVLEVSSELKGDTAYFKRLSKFIGDEHTRHELYWFLKARDIKDVDWDNDRPTSRYQAQQVQLSLAKEYMFLRDAVILPAHGAREAHVQMQASVLFEEFRDYLARGNFKYSTNKELFGKELSKLAEGPSRMPGCTKKRCNVGMVYTYDVLAFSQAMVQAGWMSEEDLAAVQLELQFHGVQLRKVSTESASEAAFRHHLIQATGHAFESARPEWLINTTTGCALELDMYNPALGVAVEYDGPQHYEFPNPYHATQKEFDTQQARDRLKDRLCEQRGVRLYRVRAAGNVVEELSSLKFQAPDLFQTTSVQ